jgi:hypothetical protein
MNFSFNFLSPILLSALLFSYAGTTNASCQTKSGTEINSSKKPKLMNRIDDLKNSMIDYMKTSNASYTEKDVNECVNILTEYLDRVEKTNSREDGMLIVKSTILKLNKLNENCNLRLIETGEREKIAEIIILAGNEKGYNSTNDDITEEWREW